MSIVAGVATSLTFESGRLLEELVEELEKILLVESAAERRAKTDALLKRLGTLHANVMYSLKEAKRVTTLLGI